QALIGGGSVPKPGEVSLAHHGILFLDELPEFQRYVLEMLRQPLEGGEVTVARVHGSIKFPAQIHLVRAMQRATVTVARVHGSIKFPAKFMLVAAMNPTPSGYHSDNPKVREKYLAKL